ncbi:hypothetical protein OSB04_001410 [Centaurea solstitialis]|uniref:Uncharacterized protein n=1 Tax=Centaurea solstitialis TaxID=347529 RepID=A0AA38WUF0_9ASTR|nr:hypothetical protein OSB04_001410 [Centaurea solstitialis]
MEVENILHMNTGNGELSYAQNSLLQEIVIRKSLPVLRHAIKGMANLDIVFDQCFKIADLGCSSGKNTLFVASTIIDIVDEVCKENNRKTPQFQVCLNDLYSNDFNTVFEMLPNFLAKLKKQKGENFGPTFVSAVPGSFYGRLFPDKTLHLIHSSYSIHWLSQVPEGLHNNKSNIYMAKSSPPNVFDAYQKQFYSDFTKFLQLRSMEVVCGGRMVLTFVGRSSVDPTSDDGCRHMELLAESLVDLLKEVYSFPIFKYHPKGLVQESDINSFNLPYYTPCEDEVRNVVYNEGSFFLDSLNVFQGNWDPYDTDYTNIKDFKDNHIHGKNAVQMSHSSCSKIMVFFDGLDVIFDEHDHHHHRRGDESLIWRLEIEETPLTLLSRWKSLPEYDIYMSGEEGVAGNKEWRCCEGWDL